MLCVIEGMDAAGKATQTERLAKHIADVRGESVKTISFPNYGTKTGQLIRGHLKRPEEGRWEVCHFDPSATYEVPEENPTDVQLSGAFKGPPTRTEKGLWKPNEADGQTVFQALQSINRYEVASQMIKWLRAGNTVVCDRYWPSGYAYGLSNGQDAQWLLDIHSLLPQPDVCLFVDVTLEESIKRRPERRDFYETRGDMLQKVRGHYLDLFKAKPQLNPDKTTRWEILDGMGSVDDVERLIRETVYRVA